MAQDSIIVVGRFSWQPGCGAFSFSNRELEALIAYIDGQAGHHRAKTFQEQYLDPRYILGLIGRLTGYGSGFRPSGLVHLQRLQP
jgi:hypothetical protein